MQQPRRAVHALLLWLALAACAPVHAEAVVRSPADHRDYAAFVLPNGLRVVLVSDPQADKAAASLDVAVGSASDPLGREGLAHFLEHMLFLGTKKYPGAGDYQSFITSHGGSHNAYTAFENTNFFFDVDAAYLAPALGRFAQFFIDPLFTERYVQRERRAVDSEYQSKRMDDARRVYFAWKTLVNPAHPLHRYFGGNARTLADRPGGGGIRAQLLRFYHAHYSAGLMTLAVLGRERLPVLRKYVTALFSAVPTTGAKPSQAGVPMFTPGTLPARVDVTPVKDRRTLSLMFPVPPVRLHLRSKPDWYVANLLGHEGRGSLLSLLKARGWASALSAGTGLSNRDAALFEVSVALTHSGLAHVDDITALVFEYLRLIERDGVKERTFRENQRLADIDFRFQQPDTPLDTVQSIATDLQLYPAADVLRGPVTVERFDPDLIHRYLRRLRPANMLMVVTARGLPADRRAPWFDTRFSVHHPSTRELAHWRAAPLAAGLAIPGPNEFIPTDLAVKPLRHVHPVPVRIVHEPGFALWFKQDDEWRLPRDDFYFSVRSPVANDTPRDAVLTDLYVHVVNDAIDEFAYPARLAGLYYSLYRHSRGFSMRMSGFDDKQPLLLARLAATLRKPPVTAERFAIAKDDLLRRLRGTRKDAPYVRGMAELTHMLVRPDWSEHARITALEALRARDLRAFVPRLLAHVDVVALAHGNLHRADALALAEVVRRGLLAGSRPQAVPRAAVVKLPAGARYARVLHVAQDGSAVAVYFQGSDRSYAARARFALLAQILSAPFYNELRTEKQLGYVVFATSMPLFGVPGVTLVVQSPNTAAGALEAAVQDFLAHFCSTLDTLPSAQFAREKQALIAGLRQADDNLTERSDRYWNEIDRKQYHFDTRARIAGAVALLAKQRFARFARRVLRGAARRMLVVRARGKAEHSARVAEAGDVLVSDVERFKARQRLFRDGAPPVPDERAMPRGTRTALAPATGG